MENEELISGEFLSAALPPDRAWLGRYVNSDLLTRFAVYYVTFAALRRQVTLRRFCQLFVEHTGLYCSGQLLRRVGKRLRVAEDAARNAMADRNLERLVFIKLVGSPWGRPRKNT